MANYALWAMFIYGIFKYIFFQKVEAWSTIIKNMLVTSVLIQASWFLVMALVDLSTIVLTTVSAFPSQVVSVSDAIEKDMKIQICKNYVLSRKGKDVVLINAFSDKPLEQSNTKQVTTSQPSVPSDSWTCDTDPSLIDAMLPQANSFWGTFMYLWFTALNAQDYVYKTVPTSSNCVDDIVKVVINIVLDAWMLILYSIALAILVVVLIMRLWYLWVFIAISPIVVLVSFSWLFKIKTSEWIGELLDYKKALFLIFQPAIFALWMSLMFLFIVVVQWLFVNSPSSSMWSGVIVGESKNSSSSTDPVPKISSSLWNSWVIDFTIRQWSKSLKDILLSFLILILMWQLVKLSVSWEFMWFQWIKSMNKKINNITDSVWRALSSVGVVPLPGGKRVWFREITNWNLVDSVKENYVPEKYRKLLDFENRRKEQRKYLANKLWLDVTIDSLSNTQKSRVQSAITSGVPSDFISVLQKIREDNSWLKFFEIKGYVNDWIKTYKGKPYKDMEPYFNKDTDTNTWKNILDSVDKEGFDISSRFEDNDNVDGEHFSQFYHEVLWWEWNISYREFVKKYHGEVR